MTNSAFLNESTLSLFSILSELLTSLTSSDNIIRASAETQLNEHWLTQQPLVLLTGLSYLIRNGSSPLKSFAAVLLRRIALKSPTNAGTGDNAPSSVLLLCIRQDPSSFGFISSQLLESLIQEEALTVRLKVNDTISDLAAHLIESQVEWTDLVPTVLQCGSSSNPAHKSSALQIVASLPVHFAKSDLNALSSLFQSGLQDSDPSVQVAAIKASIYTMLDIDPQIRNQMTNLVPSLLSLIPPLISDSDKEELASEAIGYLIELAESFPKLFKPVLPDLITFMTQMMKNSNLEDSTRQICCELLLTISEYAPAMCRKNTNFASSVIPILLEWMSELEDDPEWYVTDDLADDDNESNETVGEQGMDRIARFLGPSSVLPVSFGLIPTMLSSQDWQKRHAGLRCISAIGEGCHKVMAKELEKVVGVVLPHLRDPHPRVRHAACNAIGQMCTDFSPDIQNKFHEAILSHLVPVMDDSQFVRVQTYAAAALVNFSEQCPKECITPYLDSIISKLIALLQNGKMYSQEQAITTLATVADSASDQFTKYYNSIMPVLINILKNATAKEHRTLRGKTMECASLVAMAVGKETFGPHAHEFISILKEIQESVLDADDPQSWYLLSTWARMCKVLGTDFAPFVEIVLPPLFASAQLKPDINVFDDEEEMGDQYTEEEGWEVHNLRGQRICIKTSVLDEKCTAVEMLLCYAQEMGALFHPFVEKVVAIVLPLLKFYFHDGVRVAAAAVLPLLLVSWIKAEYPREKILGLFHEICKKMFDTIHGETDTSIVSQILTAFHECLEPTGANSLSPEILTKFVTETRIQLQEYRGRLDERQASRNEPDYDEEDDEALQDEEFNDEALLSALSRCFHELFKTHTREFLPFFDQLLEEIQFFMNSSDPAAKQWALCVFDDVIEYLGPDSLRYQQYFLQQMIASLTDKSPDVRQSAAYGVGVAGKCGGTPYVSICTQTLPVLFQMIEAPDSRTEENTLATENAISAIAKICRGMGSTGSFDLNAILSHWIQYMPLLEDDEEALDTYSYLLDLANQGHRSILNPSEDTSVIRFVTILSRALAQPSLLSAHPDLIQRMVDMLRNVLSGVSEQLRGQIWNGLDADTRGILQKKGYI